ncbi:MAG TPA: family 78 glycoside hydrolase catalytic domain [Parapedobacter sp.]|uniref:alpha-L-rhamnosidase n=1 Tax=Parapedobacter sp. TaxID=1958893 RepID=UPI002D13918F|nr:family 78 glycoside hydrolase catalytic domain [Parapedobacter sp.]HWK59447.1 family 78 glycoside hydrolase catalytic domain [Parapedobacter sp.]
MTRVKYIFFLSLAIWTATANAAWGKEDLRLANLKVEYADQPIGLMIAQPHFSWEIAGNQHGIEQRAYQVLVADSPDKLANLEGNIWDSGVVQSNQSVGIRYEGEALQSSRRYYWKVRIWDARGDDEVESDVKVFETALLNQSDWQADWTGFPFGWVGKVLYFRHVFHCPQDVTSAKVYLAGIGYHELSINGKKVGKNVLDPATSDYSKRVYYTTFDVSDFLEQDNVMLISVAPGWYGVPKMRLQMDLTFADGTTRRITSNDVRTVTTGPTVRSGILDGEYYDARLEQEEWLLPTDTIIKGLPNKTWGYASIVESPGGQMVSQHLEPIQVVEEFHPVVINEVSPGVYVLDAGQNMAGWLALNVTGARGEVITMRFAETVYDDGTVNQENLRTAEATDTYVLKGDPSGETWEPRFTYHGFRYVQIEGYPTAPQLSDFTIKRVRSAVADAGQFNSSNQLLNDIWLMVKRTEASNLHSIPTDCPQRDERMGWMNDMTVRIEQAIYNYDMSRFYPKYLADVADTQDELGRITCTAPYRYGARPADPVSASYLLLAFSSYEYYGNKQVLHQHYAGLKAWVDYLNTRTNDAGILEYSYYGDWSPPAAFGVEGAGYGAISKNTPGPLVSTGFLYHSADILAKIASIIGKQQDAAAYQALATRTSVAFNNQFWDEEAGGYGTNNQSCNSLALSFGLAQGDRKVRTVESLVKDVKERGYHLTTGNICTKYLLEELTENGHIDVAYRIATQTTYPSWGFMIENGATTLWERWEYETGGSMNSHNHPMMGSVGSWLYKYLLGIRPTIEKPGFEAFVIKPYIPSGLDASEGTYQSIRGEVKSAWHKTGNRLVFEVGVPGNSVATVYVPAAGLRRLTIDGKPYQKHTYAVFERQEGAYAVFTVPSGDYHFESDWN